MAVLILFLTWLSPVLPAMKKLPPPVNLNLTSNHFIHWLRWERGEGTPPGVSYNVSVIKETGYRWLPVAGCQSVVDPLLCELTEAFSDPSEKYFTRVTAHLGFQTSPPVSSRVFQPIRDSVLEPPLLSAAPCGRNLCVQLKPPLEHLRHVYERLKYKLNVSNTEDTRKQYPELSVSLDGLVLDNVAPGEQYCVSVCFSDPLEDRHSHHSQPVCVVTPSTFKPDQLVWSLLTVLTFFVVFSLAFLACAGFICLRKRPLPLTLTSVHHVEEARILAASCAPSFSPLYNDKSTAPPVREKRSSSTSSSESSDEEESTPESTGGGGGLYLSKKGTNLPSSSSSSSASSLISVPLNTFSNLPSHSSTPSPPPHAQNTAETAPLAGHTHKLNTHTHSADRTPPTRTICPPTGGGEEVRDSLNVNLLTLTFDRDQEEEEEEEKEWKRPEFSSNMNPFLLTERVAVETVFRPEDEEENKEDEEDDDDEEEEAEEPSGYIRH